MPKSYSSTRYNPKHIQDIIDIVDYTIAKHKRVAVFRFDVHFPYIDQDNPRIYRVTEFTKKFLGSLKAKLEHLYGHVADFDYLWCKEQHIDKGTRMPHYHFAIFLDGNYFNSWGNFEYQGPCFRRCLEEAYMSAMDSNEAQVKGKFQFNNVKTICTYAGKNYDNAKEDTIDMLSYLAKLEGKLPGQRCWGKSNLHA
ncbi:YagK/YfjJ domain-containing protein [Vibrio parahaemolyticus]|uniref:YagK/YfjJ domain-containing protein n=1 Tax=Vibrio parahaemolyticus TaxID=670 RepID=UPI00226B2472|nr:inovirus-type Gp2 protein [Vibrio parahaemolyticus]MCX8819249.1 inovirus Gp2 family protein [Vibrio parahaemolyticus]